jgi:diaminopimelate epimerase
MTTLTFVKMVGTGNDFIMVDNRKGVFDAGRKELIERLCDRRNGVGADGIILIEDSESKDFRMRIINPDGSEVDMCGNGARCAVEFARMIGIDKTGVEFETLFGPIRAERDDKGVRLNLGKPRDIRGSVPLEREGEALDAWFINTGVPHVVVFVSDVARAAVRETGRWVRYHERFAPKGANCNFVEIRDEHRIAVRTYERGVEDETFSCGTGTCASALVSVLYKGCAWPVYSSTPRGETLLVDSAMTSPETPEDFFLAGPVATVFSGTVDL